MTLARLPLNPSNDWVFFFFFLSVVDPLRLVHKRGRGSDSGPYICLNVCRSLDDLRNLSKAGREIAGKDARACRSSLFVLPSEIGNDSAGSPPPRLIRPQR